MLALFLLTPFGSSEAFDIKQNIPLIPSIQAVSIVAGP